MQRLNETIGKIEKIDFLSSSKTQRRLDNLTKPPGSLGRLEDLAKRIVEITQNDNPAIRDKVIFTMAADHGVAAEGISAYPKEVTAQMVYNFLRGGAGINVLSRHIGARVVVVDMGVAEELKIESEKLKIKKINFGTKNMLRGPAMTRQEAFKSIEAGIEVFEAESEKGIDIVGTGDMGIGNTTASSALTAVFTRRPVEEVTGRGTGINDGALKNKIEVIKRAIEVNKPDPQDPIDVLSKIGGFEIAGLSGVILAAASRRVPVVIDGFISGAAALAAYHLEPKVKDYLIAGHCSVERGHRAILELLGLAPLLDLDLRLGEGTGAALAISIVEASIKILTQMATFKSASISEKIDR
jgi:nicotinate-nucleotide--dimethylbenzimidazole phosphoribosyltransferase